MLVGALDGENQHQPSFQYLPAADLLRCITMSEAAIRFLIDSLGIDRVVLGSDWPFVPWDPSPTGWIQGLSQEEKEKILYQKLVALLNL